MRGRGRRVSRPALLVGILLVACVIGCDAIAPNPSASLAAKPPADAAAGPPPLADVLAFRGSFARTGQMPGPGPEGKPVQLWVSEPTAGFEAAPLVVGGLVIAASLEGEVIALDGATGEDRGHLQLPAGVSGSPAAAGDILFIVTRDGELRAVSVRDWKDVWTRPGYDADAAPAVAGDLVLAGRADGALVARRIEDGTEAWVEPAAAAARVSVADGRVAMSGASSDKVKMVELDDRTSVFEESTGGAEAGTVARLDGNAYVAHRDVNGGSNGVDAFDNTGKRIWPSWDEPERVRIDGLAVDNDNVYVVTDTPARVHAIERASGRTRWVADDVNQANLGDIALVDGLLYIVGFPNGLSAIDTSNSEIVWSVPLATARPCRIVVSGGLVIAATSVNGKGRIVAFAGPSDPRRDAALAHSPSPDGASAAADPSPTSGPGVRRLNEHQVDADADLIGGTLGPDGTLYVPDVANHRILVLDRDGNQRWWGEQGAGKGQFDFTEATQNDGPAGIAVSPDGELIAVGEAGNHRIQLFNRDLEHIRFIGRTGRGDGQFITPYPTVGADHRIWVVDPGRADVQIFDEAGAFLGKFPSDGDTDHELSRPGPVFVRDDADEIFVPDFAHRRVAVFRKDGSWLRSYEANSKERFYLGEVNIAMTDPDGRVLIVDTSNRIFFLDPDGHLVQTLSINEAIGSPDPSGLAISPTGRLFVVDRATDRILEAQLESPFWPAD
ncbi:MAG TPA: PQQ-binding-like beta-propeller repeat protein [Candidatus Limnocylindrales bacterium]|nr:PQQ-binding-like beta-propeller repeat protein [Candidatus Limnocylindrales bacterium]